MKDSRELAADVVRALEDKKGEDVIVIDLRDITSFTDYFVIATGNNVPQVQAMSDAAEEAMAKNGVSVTNIEGYQSANWILMDYSDVIVHIFDKESRSFYDLERLWKDGKFIKAEEI